MRHVPSNHVPEIALRRLIAQIGRIPGDHGDWDPEARPPLQIVPAAQRALRTLFVTKPGGLLGVDPGTLARKVTFLSHYGVPSLPIVTRVAAECTSKRLDFVGDLDPLDLTVFLVLASRLKPFGVRVRHLGVGGAWIERCRRNAKRQQALPTIALSRFEGEHFALLRKMPVEWDVVLGREALAMLDSGAKLELEGATNPVFYSPPFTRELEREVFGAASARRARGRG